MSAKPRPSNAVKPRSKRWIGMVLVVAGVAVAVTAMLMNRSDPATTAPARQVASKEKSDDEILAEYAGSASCRECHAQEHAKWVGSNHELAERPPRMELDRSAFEPARTIEAGWQSSHASLTNGQCVLVAPGLSGNPEAFGMVGVIGVTPLRQFLAPFPGGRLQAVELAYDPHAEEWFDIYGAEDRRPGEWGHWTGRGMNWNSMCASCHNTRLLKNYQSTNDTYRTRMAEQSVGCEACHGPMNAHVQWQRTHANQHDPTLVTLSTNQMLHTCATCHSRRAELTGNFTPGADYFDHHALVIPDETDIFYSDGQVRDENYEFTSFLSSAMHRAGVRCVDCHDPHTTKPILPGNQLCLRCHTGAYPNSPLINPVAHSFHKIGSAGAECVNCHMPHTVYMERHPRRDHGFTIPDPLLTIRHGVPNACNRCHTDQDAAWALEAVERWYGPRMDRPTRHRAEVIAAVRKGDVTAKQPLLDMLKDDKSNFWQAVAAGLLQPWALEPETSAALLGALDHEDPLVRVKAVEGLEPGVMNAHPAAQTALRRVLNDPVRSVRVRAAWALRNELDVSSPAGLDLLRFINFNSDQPAGLLQRSVFHRARGQDQKALEDLRRAVTWDPNSAPLRHELAVMFSVLNQPQAAIEQLRQACLLEPAEAEYHYKLALAYHEAGQPNATVEMLQEAVRLDPAHGRAWYNLGLAHHEQGQPERALETLARAEAVAAQDAMIPYARATILAQLGRRQEARAAATRALEIEPALGSARELLELLGP